MEDHKKKTVTLNISGVSARELEIEVHTAKLRIEKNMDLMQKSAYRLGRRMSRFKRPWWIRMLVGKEKVKV